MPASVCKTTPAGYLLLQNPVFEIKEFQIWYLKRTKTLL